ncbi:hypothetical protein JL722_3681 [Aureococcus anophagefferens]|nr:hypothetical protein JL722_3681 [Aureococcus anophagefferens]
MPPKAAAKKTKKKKAKRKAFDDVTNGAASSSAEKKTKKEKTFERVNVDDVFIADLQSAFAGLTEGAPSSGDERRAFFVNLVNNQRSITDELTRKLGVFELRSFPAATAEEIVSEICVFLLMNFDVPTNHPGNGVTNPKNGCVIWLRQGQWTAFEKFEMIKQADASTIAAKLLVMDRIPLITKVTEHGPDAEFVEIIRRASGGDAKAKAGGLLKQYYLMIMAMFELHACARGAPARVVGVGAESRKLCDCFWSTLSTVKVIGMIMHPDKWHRGPSKLEAAKITAEELDKSGFETERLEHVALDDCATNIARACGVQLLEGSGITFFTRCFDRIDPDIIKAARRSAPSRFFSTHGIIEC